MSRYIIGETARMSATFAVNGVLTTPTGITCTVTKPDGTIVSPAPTVVVDSVGAVHADVGVDVAGQWHWRIVGTGAAAGAFEGSFSVLTTPLDDLLRVAQFRAAKPNVAADDDTIQIYIDAATSAIIKRYGKLAPVTVRIRGGGRHIWLPEPVASITTIKEGYGDPVGLGAVTLDTTDWTLGLDSVSLYRWNTGTHVADVWGDWIDVTYMPLDTTADRQRVVIGLVQLDLNHNPGVTSERIGDWEQTYADNALLHYSLERDLLLDSLAPPVAFA